MIALWALLACAPEADAPADSDTSPDTDTVVELEPPALGVQLSIDPFVVPAYTETYHCKVTVTSNDEPLDVVHLEHVASANMHHFNVWGLAVAPDHDLEGDCDDVWAQTNMALASPLYGSQTPTFSGDFPTGVAGRLPAHQGVLLEYHVVNASPDDQYSDARLNLVAAEPGTVSVWANGLFGSYTDIHLHPGDDVWLAQKCYTHVDLNLFAFGSHMHSRGREFEIWTLGPDGVAGERIYDSTDYHAPKLEIRSDDPLLVPAGSGLEFRCHFVNDTPNEIVYGETSADEMCMMGAVYFPDQGFQFCDATP